MSELFGTSAVGGLPIRRRFKKRTGLLCAPSFGVANGFVADIERPLPAGAPVRRRSRRIPSSFHMRVGEDWIRVAGDVSGGGALVLFPQQLGGTDAELVIELADGSNRWRARGEVIGVERRGARYAHHIRFTNTAQLGALDEVIARSLSAGETRLATS